MSPRQRLRAFIARPGYTMAPGAYDTLSRRGSSSRPASRPSICPAAVIRAPTDIPISDC